MAAAAIIKAPTRPVLRWHGGKWKLAPWIISHFPPHRVYVEPFGGAASVLLRKPRSYAEVYNDLDEDAVNLFEVVRSPAAPRLVERLRLTPFSRLEFERAYEPSDSPVERAAALVIRSFMGFGSDGHNPHNGRTGFRANSNRSGTTPAHDWANFPDCLPQIIDRFRAVVIECRNAGDVMSKHDGPETLHYVDPPYVPSTRSINGKKGKDGLRVYAHELTFAEHQVLLAELRQLVGMVVLSGYAHPLYDAALSNWRRVEIAALADGARPRVEVLWINPQACTALDRARSQHDLFRSRAEA